MIFLSYFLVGILTVLLSLEESTAHEGQPRVIGPRQRIVAAPGDDVILLCHLEPGYNVEMHTVEWSKPDIKPDPSDPLGRVDYVHLYRDQKTAVKMQLSSYIGRTDLPADGLKQGNISLKIRNVTPEDTGRYRCFIPKLNSKEKESIIYLVVDQNVVKMTEMPHHATVQPLFPKDEIKGGRSRSGVLVSLVLAVLVVLILGIHSCFITKVQNKPLESEVSTSNSSLAEVLCSREEAPEVDVLAGCSAISGPTGSAGAMDISDQAQD